MKELNELRQQIDSIDDQLLQLFTQRMDTVAEVAAYKQANHLPVMDAAVERKKMRSVAEKVPEAMTEYALGLYDLLLEQSRTYQNKLISDATPLQTKIKAAIEETPRLFPQSAMVACQGVEGAFSQLACEKLFSRPDILYFRNFEGVFTAIENGLCEYGVIPLENSTAGSVKQIYDLMIQHNFNIIRSTRLKIDHSLLAKKGTAISQIKEIFSHEQAINQCSDYLKTLGDVKVTCVENTAAAAKLVSESSRDDVAALCSRSCISLYNLDCLASSVQNSGNNYTRFICISKNLAIYPGADRTSIMVVLPHRPGALYKMLARFNALGINLIKLESRPIPERDFEFMFYFDLDTSIYSEPFIQLIGELDTLCDEFKYLGSYSEVV